MSVLFRAESPIEQTGASQKSNVSGVQRSQRPPNDRRLFSEQNTPSLSVCGRARQQVLDFIERQPAVYQLYGSAFRHEILRFWLRRKNGEPRCVARQVSILNQRARDISVLKPFPFPSAAACSEHNHLLVADALRLAQAVKASVSELCRQRLAALANAFPGNHQDENAARFEPTIGVRQENRFHALATALTNAPVIRWIEVQQRKGFRRAMYIQAASLHDLVRDGGSLRGAKRV